MRVGTVAEVTEQGPKVMKGIAVFAHEGQLYAVENRCPHMGFPLHLGSVCDGILTCHWHHARFDVCSGGTLDPWADDVPVHDLQVADGVVYVNPRPRRQRDAAWHLRRLREGLEQNLSLIIAKAVVALVSLGVPEAEIARVGMEFGTTYRREGWGSGLTILTANLNVLPKLDTYGRILALFQGLVHVARDCAGRPPRHQLQPLPPTDFNLERFTQWYRNCVEVRDTEGAERILHTALAAGADDAALADLMVIAATDHFYLDGGHILDFHNKAFEAVAQVGADVRAAVLTSLIPALANPTRSEELQNWRAPVDLVGPLRAAFAELESGIGPGPDGGNARATAVPLDEADFVQTVLGDDPRRTVAALTDALRAGVAPARLAQLVTLAAALRMVHFHTQNDFADWIAVLHTFTNAHAVHQRLRASRHPLLVRGVYHVAMRIYLDRFLNIPSAPLPRGDLAAKAGYTTDLAELLQICDRQQQVTEAANWVAQYLDEGAPLGPLWNTLGHLFLREDAEFHTFQCYEAAVQEFDLWAGSDSPLRDRAQRSLLYGLTRYLAAHAPTARELPTVARIAWRLHRGDKLFEDEAEA
ncbi:MAG: Rieske 2Fe-2S domain-containing protein [Alicyclobacillus sp.]|nr:Rieske 2Fe-2S domain-containing protein [Alicyclobacillus sp.]